MDDVPAPTLADEGVRDPRADEGVRVPILDLGVSRDSHGREIYVESHEEYTGRPRVWYKRGRGERFSAVL